MAYTIKTFKVSLAVSEEHPVKVLTADGAAAVLRAIYKDLDADQEHFAVLSLNGANRITGYKVIASGQMGSAEVDFKLTFRALLALGGPAFIVAHNHPSGEPKPSGADLALTRKLQEAAKLLGFTLLDHIILGSGAEYHSFQEKGDL